MDTMTYGRKVREVEAPQAPSGLATHKVAVPGGFPAEVSCNLPAVLPIENTIFRSILDTGRFPIPLLGLVALPLEKPGKEPKTFRLSCALSKAWGLVDLNRLKPTLDAPLIYGANMRTEERAARNST